MSNESDYSTEQTAEPKDFPREEEENENEAESQFIYNEQSNSLLCIGEHFDHIPKSIIENYARKTRVKNEKNFFENILFLLEIFLLDSWFKQKSFSLFERAGVFR